MSTTIDNRVVEMRFDNRNFEQNVSTSMSTLDKLKQKLNLTGATKGFEDINTAARRVDMNGIGNGVDVLRAKFSALEVMAVTTLANITNSAVNAGKRMVSALTIEPIKTGFQEYETQIGAIQTILANTKHEGTNLKDVNAALDELNTYADKTIYNFTQMTRNIGTFTAAGVKLDTSVASIKGIANLAAISGSTSQQASTAMYQLSQALAAGRVSLMDWNSVVNAGMGGKIFQDALKRTSEVLGTGADEAIKKYGSFRESLTQGQWLTTEVLTETLKQLSGAYTEADLIAQGYSKKQAKEIMDLAETAVSAATEVKTFTQLFDTLKEAAQSGWSQTWRILVGDFEEAKKLFTDVSNTVGGMIGVSAEARNTMLQGWKDMGGRKVLIDALVNVFDALMSVVKPIKSAFRDIFPPITSKQLYNLTVGLRELTESFKLSGETADKLKRTFKGIFSVFDIFGKILTAVAKGIGKLFTSGGVNGFLDLILSITAAIGDFFTSLNGHFDSGPINAIFSGISELIGSAINGIGNFGDVLSSIGKGIGDALGGIWDAFKTVFTWISDNVSFGDIFAGLAGGSAFVAFKKLSGAFDGFTKMTEKGLLTSLLFGTGNSEKTNSLKTQFTETLNTVSESLVGFTQSIRAGALVAIAGSLAILGSALKTISEIDGKNIAKSLVAISIMFTMMSVSFKSIIKVLTTFKGEGILKAGLTLMMLAKSIDILAGAMEKIGSLSFKKFTKGIIGMVATMLILTKGLKALNGVKINISTLLSITIMAKAMASMGKSLAKVGSLSWKEVARGLAGMGGALAELVITLKVLEKVSGFKTLGASVSLLIAVQSLDEISDALAKIGKLSWKEIARGLTGMGGALIELGAISGALGKLAGFSGIIGAGIIVGAASALGDIANALAKIGKLSWKEIARGLTGMGGALLELGAISGALGKLAGFSGLVGAATLVIAVKSLDKIAKALVKIGALSWGEIARGLVGMGGALTEVAVVSGVLGRLAGFSGLVGATTILIAVQGLGDIADALKKFGSMTWDEIKRGLVGMGAALAEIAIVTGALGKLGGLSSLIGSGSILIAVQGLGDIADALKKFGEMSWDEIGRGLTAMGAALTEIALGGILNTLSGLGSISIANVAEPLGVLADSVKKWSGVTVPKHLGLQLGVLAAGIKSFTFGGLGAMAISEVAGPLGTMADSVKKWSGVNVPEGLPERCKTLAEAVHKFTFAGLGAMTISTVAGPLGTMADSVKKWSGVTVPGTLNEQLKGLSNGIKSFTWAFMGGWSLSAVAGPLGELAADIKKWNGVTVPETLGDQLKTLSSGVKSFSWAFMGGWSLDAIVGPLGKLAGSVKKWNGIAVPENLGDQLKTLSSGIKSFSFAFAGGWSLETITGPLGKLAGSVKKWNGVTVPANLGSNLKTLASGVKAFSGISDISGAAKSIGSISTSISKLSGVQFGSITSGMNSFAGSMTKLGASSGSISGLGTSIANNIVKPLNNLGPKLKSAGSKAVSSLASGLKSSGAVKSAANSIANTAAKAVTSKTPQFRSAGTKMGSALAKGIESKKGEIKTASIAGLKVGVTAIRGYHDDFRAAGAHIAQGLASGINSKKGAVRSAVNDLASLAEKAARLALKIKSPSRVFAAIGAYIPQGLVMGMQKLGGSVKKAAAAMGQTAIDGTNNAMSRVASLMNLDMDTQPTIRPVLDLSDVRSGVGTINGMFGMTPSVGVMSNIGAISSMMNQNNQNGANDDVISAINKLGKQLGNVGNSYTINGVNYEEGSDVADALSTIVRAAKIERRI